MNANLNKNSRTVAAVGISVALIAVLQALAEILQKVGMPVSLALGLLPVLVAAQFYGPKVGAICGGFFGITSLIIAVVYSSAIPLYSVAINPLVSVLPRILVGVASGLVYKGVKSKIKNEKKSVAAASVAATVSGVLTNTVLFLGFFFLFAGGKTYGSVTVDFRWILASVVSINAAIELGSFSVIVPLVVGALEKSAK